MVIDQVIRANREDSYTKRGQERPQRDALAKMIDSWLETS